MRSHEANNPSTPRKVEATSEIFDLGFPLASFDLFQYPKDSQFAEFAVLELAYVKSQEDGRQNKFTKIRLVTPKAHAKGFAKFILENLDRA